MGRTAVMSRVRSWDTRRPPTTARPSGPGVSAEQIENALYSAYGSRQASTIYTPTNHHDDRLRARGRARGRDSGGRHLQAVPAPVPADHDDDDGGAPRHAPDRAWHRGGRGRAALLMEASTVPV